MIGNMPGHYQIAEKVADADRKRHFVREAIQLAIEALKEKAEKSGLAGRMGAGK